MMYDKSKLAAIAIGRNEGDALRLCIESLIDRVAVVFYVDSGSTDGSVAMARSLGAEVLELDPQQGAFTAARARFEGSRLLMERHLEIEYIMFSDGDCEVVDGWLEAAMAEFQNDERIGVVTGRRRERFPDDTCFNRLLDMEWNSLVGEAKWCGGDSVIRVAGLRQVGTFSPTMISCEEPDLCIRLRHAGWRVRRIDADMTIHDAAMKRIDQWWRRSVRGGYASMDVFSRHWRTSEKPYLRKNLSNWFWVVIAPLTLIALAWPTEGWSLLGFLIYPLLMLRVARYRMRKHGDPWKHALLYGFFCVVGKLPELIGHIRYIIFRALRLRTRNVFYNRHAAAT